MYVRNSMTTNPYTVSPEATIAEAMDLMRNKSIKRLPVVKNGQLVGIITHSQLLEVSPSPATSLSVFEINYLLAKTKIDGIMTKKVITVTPDTLLEEASLIMRKYKIGGIPVLENNELVGIITETDVFDAFIEIMGFRDKGARITIEVGTDHPGVLAEVAGIIAGFNVNITHIAAFRSELIVRINTANIKEIIEAIEKSGYKVISVIKND
ncbi:MAG: CBS domain-containing protein [Eubacteriales bacterium]